MAAFPRSVLLSIAGGLLVTLTVPPFGWWPLVVPGIALLAVALRGAPLRRRLGLSFLFGAALYVPSLWWMTQFSLPGGIIVGLIQATMTMIGLSLVRTDSRATILLTLPGGLVAADVVRSLWPFGGLPLGGIDLGQADGPFAALAPYGGRLLIVATVAVLGAALGDLLPRPHLQLTPSVHASTLAALAGALVLAQVAPDGTAPNGSVTRIAAVQGGGELGLRASPDNARRTFEAAVAATGQVPDGVELILWPENVVDVPRLDGSPQLAVMQRLARTTTRPCSPASPRTPARDGSPTSRW